MLDKDFKEKWTGALRSGDYVQTDGVLCNIKGHCCLGVAAEVLGAEKHLQENNINYTFTFKYDENDSAKGCVELPGFVLSCIGLSKNEEQWLMEMNDNGDSFETIANYIDQNL